MADLNALMQRITNIQARGVDMVDPMVSMQQAQIALLAGLVDAVSALQSAAPAEPAAATTYGPVTTSVPTDAVLQNMVAEAVSAAFGKLESAVVHAAAAAQPEVANTGSGAAPVAPADSQASASASPTPDAAGTAPQQAPQA